MTALTTGIATADFVPDFRRRKSIAFDLPCNSTARRVASCDLWGRPVRVYSNANLSIYSAQKCNAACPFCVEELRPASRGIELAVQKRIETDEARYFDALEETLDVLKPLNPSVSITGGEASKDPRLPRICRTIASRGMRKRTLTTNGSGLFDIREGRRVIDWLTTCGIRHLNISIAHADPARSGRIMRFAERPSLAQLREIATAARAGGTRTRLSCVLLQSAVATIDDIAAYLDFAESVGIDNVIFRQLMKTDPQTHAPNSVVRYSDAQRVALEPILDALHEDQRFTFRRQIVGYYYYVEVWRYRGIDVVFEEADLAQLERVKQSDPETIHELIFHPSAQLASTWQPWDGILGPPRPS